MLLEEQYLQIIKTYNVPYVLIFTPDDLQKFCWIARIAGYNETDYLTASDDTYEPTALGSEVTLLRLLLDDPLHPRHFTKLYDNGKDKIYRAE